LSARIERKTGSYSWKSRHARTANKNPGQWKAHGRYLARESATQGGRAAEAGFNAIEQNLDISTTLDNWQGAGDEQLFKVIVSPVFGDRLNFQQHTRELMPRNYSLGIIQVEFRFSESNGHRFEDFSSDSFCAASQELHSRGRIGALWHNRNIVMAR
jgi:hypothetical protein